MYYSLTRCKGSVSESPFKNSTNNHNHDDLLRHALYLAYGKFFSYADVVKLMSNFSLQEKAEVAHRIVEEALRTAKSLFKSPVVSISFSGGKGSLTVLDIVLYHVPRDELYVVYCNTLNEYPGNTSYVMKIVKEYFYVKKLVEVLPRFSPWTIWRIFGFPKEGRGRYYTPACCVLLKELPAKLAIERYGINLDFTGIQAAEALHRLRSIADYGLIRRTKYVGREVVLKRAIIRAMPIGIWLEDDVWSYVKLRGLPVNPVYEKYGIERQGCFACTNTRAWREVIMRYNEGLYEFIKLKIDEWGIQRERVRFNNLMKTVREKLNADVETLYVIREHFY